MHGFMIQMRQAISLQEQLDAAFRAAGLETFEKLYFAPPAAGEFPWPDATMHPTFVEAVGGRDHWLQSNLRFVASRSSPHLEYALQWRRRGLADGTSETECAVNVRFGFGDFSVRLLYVRTSPVWAYFSERLERAEADERDPAFSPLIERDARVLFATSGDTLRELGDDLSASAVPEMFRVVRLFVHYTSRFAAAA